VDEHDDHEDMEDDAAHAEASEAGHEPGPAPDHGASTEGSATEAAAGSGDRAPAPAERPFSLFSWIRRDTTAPSSPAPEPSKEDRED
jgi:hypothetical protein